MNIVDNIYQRTVTIANGASTSSTLIANGAKLTGLIFPASMTNARLDIEVSYDNAATWHKVYDSVTGAKIDTITTQGAVSLNFNDSNLLTNQIRLVGAGNEAAARTITAILRNI